MKPESIANIVRAILGRKIHVTIDPHAETASTNGVNRMILPGHYVSDDKIGIIVSGVIHETSHCERTDIRVPIDVVVNVLEDIRNDYYDRTSGRFPNWVSLFREKWVYFKARHLSRPVETNWQSLVMFYMKLRSQNTEWGNLYVKLSVEAQAYIKVNEARIDSWIKRATDLSGKGKEGTALLISTGLADEVRTALFGKAPVTPPPPPVNPGEEEGPEGPEKGPEPQKGEGEEGSEGDGEAQGEGEGQEGSGEGSGDSEGSEGEEGEGEASEGEEEGSEGEEGEGSGGEGSEGEGEGQGEGAEGEGSEGGGGSEGGSNSGPDAVGQLVRKIGSLRKEIETLEGKLKAASDVILDVSVDRYEDSRRLIMLKAELKTAEDLLRKLSQDEKAPGGGPTINGQGLDVEAMNEAARILSEDEKEEKRGAFAEAAMLPSAYVERLKRTLQAFFMKKVSLDDGSILQKKLPTYFTGDIFGEDRRIEKKVLLDVYIDVSGSMRESLMSGYDKKYYGKLAILKDTLRMLKKVFSDVKNKNLVVRWNYFGSTTEEVKAITEDVISHLFPTSGTDVDNLVDYIKGKQVEFNDFERTKDGAIVVKNGGYVRIKRVCPGAKKIHYDKRLIIIITDMEGDCESAKELLDGKTAIVPVFINSKAIVEKNCREFIKVCPTWARYLIDTPDRIGISLVNIFEAATKEWKKR